MARTRGPFWGKDGLHKVQHLGMHFMTDGKPNTQELDKFKAADKTYRANQGNEHFVGHSQSGAVALEMRIQHPGITGRMSGTPYVDTFRKDAAKDFLNEQRNYRNQLYCDKLYN